MALTVTAAPPRNPARPRRTAARAAPLAPAVLLLLVFLAGPIVWSLYGSFTNAALTGRAARDPRWVGLENYERLLADPTFPLSLLLTVVFVVASAVVGQNVLGLGLALLTERASGVVGAVVGPVVVAAWVLPEIVAAFAAYAFFADDGTLNQVLRPLGLGGADWLYDLPMTAVVLANVWRGTAFSMLVYRAALRNVPAELTEAAAMDGAGPVQRFRNVTLPALRGTVATNLMLTTLQTLSVFTLIYVMTAGGPDYASATLPLFAYTEAFRFGDIGYGTAIATVMLLIGGVFAVAYLRVLRPERD